jgi:hypothetical protein
VRALVTAYVAGLLFAVGLATGGMTQPAKVLAFLDVAGAWDPSLALVMVGAIAVHAAAYRAIRRRPSPLFAATFAIPARTDVDLRLIAGAACFGVGWGLAGYCPGPALTALAGTARETLVFVAGMVAAMVLFDARERLAARARAATPAPAPAFGEARD